MSLLNDLYEKGGQSPWLDNLRRTWFASDDLEQLLARGVRGLTSNPSILAKSIIETDAYDDQAAELFGQGLSTEEVYWKLVVDDINNAASRLSGLYESSNGVDGYISVEVSPRLAHDTDGTIAAAHKLKSELKHPNVMVKVPATDAGLVAIEQLTAEGFNINVTLIFTTKRTLEVLDAFARGLGRAQGPLDNIHSVASYFVSRTDSAADKQLADIDGGEALISKLAVAQSKQCYREFTAKLNSDEWSTLKANGANPQRLLWASTSVKNPDLSATYYADALVGPNTVNTLPTATLEAFEASGTVSEAVTANMDEADELVSQAKSIGIDFDALGKQLEDQGAAGFVDSFDEGLKALEDQKS